MTESLIQSVCRYAGLHADAHGRAATPLDGVTVMRLHAPLPVFKAMYKPALCLILQGAKEVSARAERHVLAAGQSLIVGADLPVSARVLRASRREPYVAFAIDLDLALVREIIGQLPPAKPEADCLIVDTTDPAIADCALRLMRLVDRPDAVSVLRTAIVTELHCWLLSGRSGPVLRRLAALGGHAERIARAVAILRAEYMRPLAVHRLAAAAGMSPSSFHVHFKAATSLPPMQFQKHLRLLEARRLMAGGGVTAARAALDVGYESVSQFSREYARMFGVTPGRDGAQASVEVWQAA